MSLVTILLLLFLFLGLAFGPLLQAVLIRSYSIERGQRLAAWTIGLGLRSVYKPMITFTRNELTLKKRSFDEKHNAEYIKFGGLMGGVKRYIHDPQDRIHSFYGVPFGFVDELFGLVCDPRDSAVGHALRHEQENGQYEHRKESEEGFIESVKATFELPRGHHGVRLPDVGRLVGGSFDSQMVDWIRDIYEESQDPKASTTAFRQMLMPLGALLLMIIIGALLAGQVNTGGGGAPPSGNHKTIHVGATLLFLLLSLPNFRGSGGRPKGPSIEWRDLALSVVFAGVGLLFIAGLYLAFPMPYPLFGIPLPLGIWAVVALGMGLIIPPFVAFWLGRSLGGLGVGLGKLYITIGLLGYSRPVLTFDGGEYRIVEYDPDEWAVEPHWYRFAMTRLGVDFQNVEENWPEGTTLSYSKVKEMVNQGDKRNAPTGHVVTDLIGVDNVMGFLPEKPDTNAVHVRTDRTTGWHLTAGQNSRLITAAIQRAKQEFGGGRKPLNDKMIMGATVFMALVGLMFDWAVFF